jgi:hypothetical protein
LDIRGETDVVYWLVYGLIFILGFVLVGGGLGLARRFWAKSERPYRLAQNISLSCLALFLTLMLAELFFKVAFAQSDAWNQTLSSQNWFKRYWVTNSFGYRDVEWSQTDLQTKRKILVLGDSFAAGQGIESLDDRFSNRLGALLGQDYLVMNIATPGISTTEEIERITGFPYKPDILILQYFINDIRNAAHRRGFFADNPGLEPQPVLKPFIENSYVLNFIYWRSVRLLPGPWQPDGFDWLNQAFNDPEVWWLHQQELLMIYEGARSEQVKLVVVVFPSMTDIDSSTAFTRKVIDFFAERQVPVLDVAPLIKAAPVEQRIVSSLDAHPSVWVHHRVAEALYELVRSLE